MPFSDDVVYIFDQQIEEAGLMVVNKIDLLSDAAQKKCASCSRRATRTSLACLQIFAGQAGVPPWLEEIQPGDLAAARSALEIDYARYGAGEAQLAWLDEEVSLAVQLGEGRDVLLRLIQHLTGELDRRKAGIGHLKFIIQDGSSGSKLSITTLSEPDWEDNLPELYGSQVSLLVNARVEMPADELQFILQETLESCGAKFTIRNAETFHPAPPQPTYRMS